MHAMFLAMALNNDLVNKCIDETRFTKLVWRFHTRVYFEEGTRNSQNVQIGLANREFHQYIQLLQEKSIYNG